MRFEERYFRRKVPDPEKLERYGFRRLDDGTLYYTTVLTETDFRAEIRVDPSGAVTGILIDPEFGDEFYQIHSDSQRGAFTARIGEEYGGLLEEIARECCIPQPFVTAQANRIARQLLQEFGDRPDFPFDKDEETGVFRNPDNRKWYGIVLQVERGKLKKPGAASGEEDGVASQETVEVIKIKVRPETILPLTEREGFYECYHMNKRHWITVAFGAGVLDEEILALLGESRGFTLGKRAAGGRRKAPAETRAAEGPRKWLMPASVNRFDVPAALKRDPVLVWKHGKRVKPGDLVYLYFSAPVSAIRYQFRVVESDITYHFSEEKLNRQGEKAMRMELLREFNPMFPLSSMRKHGVGPVRGPRYMPEELEEAVLGNCTAEIPEAGGQ